MGGLGPSLFLTAEAQRGAENKSIEAFSATLCAIAVKKKKRGFRPSPFRSILLLQFYGFPFVKVDALQCVRDRGVVLSAGYSD